MGQSLQARKQRESLVRHHCLYLQLKHWLALDYISNIITLVNIVLPVTSYSTDRRWWLMVSMSDSQSEDYGSDYKLLMILDYSCQLIPDLLHTVYCVGLHYALIVKYV